MLIAVRKFRDKELHVAELAVWSRRRENGDEISEAIMRKKTKKYIQKYVNLL